MKVKVYYNKDEDFFFTEAEREEMKTDLKADMKDSPRSYPEIRVIFDRLDIDEWWELLSEEGKAKILDEAAEAYYNDTDWYASGEIEV